MKATKCMLRLMGISQSIESNQNSYVEKTMEDNKTFDAAGLLKKNPSYEGRLKYWTNELCAEKPQTFDIVLAVR
jgi:NAD+ kinase